MYTCRWCSEKKLDEYCCEHNISVCLDCCNDDCEDSRSKDEIWEDLITVKKLRSYAIYKCPMCETEQMIEMCDHNKYVNCTDCSFEFRIKGEINEKLVKWKIK